MTCSLFVGSLLAFVGGTIFKEALVVSSLLIVKQKEMALVLPLCVGCPLPIPVGVFRVGASPM